MPGVNISRAEAAERSAHLSVSKYEITLDVTRGNETFYAKSVVHFTCTKPGYETFIDAVGRSIISATLNGASVDVSNFDGESVFLKNLASTNELIIEIEGEYSKIGEGLQLSIDPADNEVYLYSQGETAYNRRMFPCFDQPDLKAVFETTAIAPSKWEVISNSNVKSVVEADGKKTWSFLPTPVIPSYIVVLVAGPYSHVHKDYVGSKTIPMGIYARKSLAEHIDAENIFKITEQGFDYFEKVFGLAYPFEKYDQIAVVDFNWGAMENSGAVTWREEMFIFRSKVTERQYNFRASTILHEMAHMWFGNMTTMKWWDDLWLNESFAEWSSYLALDEGTDFTNGWTNFNASRKNAGYRQDQLSTTHPIATDMVDLEAVNANFDMISYAKGASVLRQLFAYVGRDNFINGLKKYFDKHAFKNTTLNDLLVEFEATSGRSLKPWVDTWLLTAGVNTLRPVLEFNGDTYSSVAIAQEAPKMPVGSTELRPHRLKVALYDNVNGEIKLRKSHELDVTGALTSVPEFAGEKVGDLLLINDGDLTYAKIRFDDRSIETLKKDLGKIKDSLTRSLCWSAAWDMARDAEISASDFVDIAIAGLAGESEVTTVTGLGFQLTTTVELYAHPSHRDALRSKLADACAGFLAAAAPGSDHQLQFAKMFTSFATSPEDIERIKALLDGKLPGLKVDADLRWFFLLALTDLGVYGVKEIDAELARDKTKTGEESHAQALATIPTLAAKEAAWKIITAPESTNSIRAKSITGFQAIGQRDLIAQFVDKYFAELLVIWGQGFETGSTFVEQMYPISVTTQETLDKSYAWLKGEGKDAPAMLQRYVNEAAEGLARALRAQERDK